MPRVYFIKKARKDNPAVKAGESYYYWEFRYGPKCYSKTYPKPSQLTQSEFLSEYLSIGEDLETAIGAAFTPEDIGTAIEGAVDRIEALQDETQDKLDNMPEGFQQGPTGELLQERIDGLDEWTNNLQSVDLEMDEELDDEERGDWLDNARDEVLSADPGIG